MRLSTLEYALLAAVAVVGVASLALPAVHTVAAALTHLAAAIPH